MATPLNEDGTVDTGALRNFIDYLIEGGVVGLFVGSSTGEGPMLTDEQKTVLLQTAVEAAKGRVLILFNASETSTARVKGWLQRAADLGADGVMLTLPFYFKHGREQIVRFYEAVADGSPIPVWIYDLPAATQVRITEEQIARLAQHENIHGMKESTGDWRHCQRVIWVKKQAPGFTVWTGDEEMLGAAVLMGGDGGLLGLGSVAPRLCTELFRAADAGNLARVRELQKRLADLQEVWSCGPCSHAGLKAALAALDLAKPHVSHPLIPPAPEDIERAREVLKRCGVI